MSTFVIERVPPGAGLLTADEVRTVAAIREHADRVGDSVTAVNQITSVLDPSTGV